MSRKRLTAVLVLAAVGAAFFLLNVLTPLYADDFSYCFTFTVGEKLRVTDLSLLLRSQLGHYRYMNGRAVAHTLAQLFLMWGKPVFNAVNTAVFLLLLWTMQALMTGKREFSLPLFLFSAAGLWFVTPAFGQDFLWLTASCTYLYAVLLVLLYLLPFRRACAEDALGGCLRAALFLPFGVLAGWTQENASAALLVMAVCFLIACRLLGRPLRGWMFTGLAGNLIGLALLLLSPGQSARLTGVGGMGGPALWLRRGLSITAHGGYYLWLPALVFLALLIWRRKTDGGIPAFRDSWRRWLPTAVFLIGSLAAAYAMILSPMFPQRAWSCIVIFALIAVGNLAVLCPDLRLPRRVLVPVCAAVLAAAAFTYGQALLSLSGTAKAAAEREAQIQAALDRGEYTVTLEPIRGDSRYNCYEAAGDLSADSGQWPNTAIAMYYGLEAVHSTEEESEYG